MRYYKNDDFLIIKIDQESDGFNIHEIYTLGLNLLAKLENEESFRPCACVNSNQGIYAIFPKVPEKLTNSVIAFLINKLQQEGVNFEKEDIDCSVVQLEPDKSHPFGKGFSSIGEFLKEVFGMVDDAEDDEDDVFEQSENNVSTVTKEGHTIYKICSSVEESLAMAKQLRLENFSVIEYNDKFYLLTVNSLDSKTAKFHKFIYNHFREYFLKEHGVCYYENANYKELETLTFLDATAME